jgi:hypothetical protein
MPIVTARHVSAVATSGGGGPPSFTCSPGPMDLQIQGLEEGNREAIPVENNGDFLELVEGSQKPIQFSMTMFQDGKLVDNATGKPLNMVLKQGTFSAGTTKDTTGGLVWTCDWTITLTRSGVTSTITLRNCRSVADISTEKDGNKIKISGTAYGRGSAEPPFSVA